MRNAILYFLTSLFLLFVVESKMNVKTLRNYNGHVSQHMPKKANRLNQTYEKLSTQQISDDVDSLYSFELAEDDFQLSDTLQTVVVFACIFNLVYIFGLQNKKRPKSSHELFSNVLHVKRFILIRSIRI